MSHEIPHVERSPLLIQQRSSVEGSTDSPNKKSKQERGQADMGQTIVNLAKTCAGTGILALPYACQQGGTFVFVVGLIVIGAWNVYGVGRLVQCLKYVHTLSPPPPAHHDSGIEDNGAFEEVGATATTTNHQSIEPPPPSTATTLGKVAWVAFGPVGLQLTDSMMAILLIGIVVSYLSGVISFLSDTPLTLGPLGDALIVGAIMAALSMVPDLGYLSKASAAGLIVLTGTFVVITGYGVVASRDGSLDTSHSHNFWPSSITGLSHFFGICVYGYGIVPLTYNFRDSMKEPNRLVEATMIALSIVAAGYCMVGVGLLFLFPTVSGQILHELPHSGILPTLTRVAMALVCIVTAPLIIVPTGEMLEAKLMSPDSHYKWTVRCGVCLIGACVAVLLPTFVQVLAFVGCFCVGLVSFCIPPFLHLRLMCMRGFNSPFNFWVDVVMLVLGSIATAVGTILTIR